MKSLDALMESILEKACALNQAEDDYAEGGLRYCGKCHTPKEKMVEHGGKFHLCPVMCECAKAEEERKKEEEKRERRMRRLEARRQAGFPDKEMMNWTFDKDDGKNTIVTNHLKKYVENFDEMKQMGYGMMLFGPVGTGKTFAAAEVTNALIDKGVPCLMTNFTRIAQTLFNVQNKQEYLDSLNEFDLLVLDDLATENNTDYMKSMMFQIIDSRYRANLPMIVTTNVSPKDSHDDLFEQRLYNRLQERCMLIKVDGANKRTRLGNENAKRARELLGL